MGGGLEGPGRKSEPDWANRRTQRQTGVGREREGERGVEPTGRHGPIETNLSSTQATSLNPTLSWPCMKGGGGRSRMTEGSKQYATLTNKPERVNRKERYGGDEQPTTTTISTRN